MEYIIDDKFKGINVFVYCGGKCASKTLIKTLSKNFKTLHNHNKINFWRDYPIAKNKYSIFDVIDYNKKILNDIYIIDSYRTPIERKIASFFNNINLHLPNYKNMEIIDLINYFNSNMIEKLEEYHPLDEVMEYYGLTPFEKFNFEKKYNYISKDNIHFIKLRYADIDIWNKILSEIFKINITIDSDNIGKQKGYAKQYKLFLDNYYLPENYYNNILPKDIHFNIYNTKEEQIMYLNKWKNKILTDNKKQPIIHEDKFNINRVRNHYILITNKRR